MARQHNLVGVTPGGPITEKHLVGAYLWYSISDDMISIARVRRAATEAGLNPDRWPKTRRAEHVFQEACRRVEGRHTNGTTEEIRAEQVVQDESGVVYQITKHVWDRENRLIEHPKALRVTYDKGGDRIKFERLESSDRTELRDLEHRIREHFENNATKMAGHNMRTILRHYLEAVGAENMRGNSGGIYFLAMQNPQPKGSWTFDHHGAVVNGLEFIAQLEAFLKGVYGRPLEWHKVPCMNDEGQREFLKRKFVENCDRELEEYRDRLIDLVRNKDKRTRGFRRDLVANLIDQRKQIEARRAKFVEILNDELGELQTNMDLADRALAKFIEADEEQAA